MPFINASPSCCDSRNNIRKVLRALDEDARCRVPGVTEGLYTLESLKPFSRFKHGFPVVGHDPSAFGTPKNEVFGNRAMTSAVFRERFDAIAPFLTDFDMKHYGLVLAGGACAALVMCNVEGARLRLHDLDFFLVGHESDDRAEAAIYALGHHLLEKWGDGTSIYRTQGCVTFFDSAEDGHIVQVILRRYSTIAEVIHGFDIGACAVAFDGEEVRLTALGLLAANHGAIVLNLPTRRPSYEHRLSRYWGRGYDLVLPDLDAGKLEQIDGFLPLLHIGITSRAGVANPCGCLIWALYIARPGLEGPGDEQDAQASDYSLGGVAYGDDRKILRNNIRALCHPDGIRPGALCASAPFTRETSIPDVQVDLDENVALPVIHWALSTPKIHVKTLVGLLGRDGAAAVILDFLQTMEVPPVKTILEYFEAHKRFLRRRPDFRIPFVFMRVEENTALTGPFPRELVTPAEWYGRAYASD